MKEKDIGGVWRTIGGRRIFINEGQDLASAMKESGKFNKKFKEVITNVSAKNDEEIDKVIGTIKLNEKEHVACNNIYNAYKDNNCENLSLIDIKTGEQKGKINTSGNLSSVGFSKEQETIMSCSKEKSLIAIHNHPGDSTFSLNDIYTMVEYEKIGGIIVVTKDYIYSLKPNYNNSELSIGEKGYDEAFEDELGNINDKMLYKYPMYTNNQLYHMSYKEIFDTMGWEYGRERRK